MNRIAKFMLCIVSVLALASCSNEGGESTNPNALATPEFTYSVTGNSIMVSWEAIEGAAYYEITLVNKVVDKTNETVYRFDDLDYNTEYTIKLQAIAVDATMNSKVVTQKAKTEVLKMPQYCEWYPTNGAAASAISNNGRWVVGGNDRSGFTLDLAKNEMVEFTGVEFFDVADDGTAVGASFMDRQDGDAVILIGDNLVKIDFSELSINLGMSCATGITPDGTYVVGWFWEYDIENSYFAQQYGYVIPFCYDMLKDRVIVPAVGEKVYNENDATAIKAVAPDRTLLGYQQSQGIHSIIWADENTPYEYVHFEYNDDYEPVFSLGDTQNLLSQSGRYIYGKAIDYANGQAVLSAAYDRENKRLYTFTGGSVTAMSDQGLVFINDVPYYLGATSYIVDIAKNEEPYEPIPFESWLYMYHDIDVASFAPTTDNTEDDGIVMESIITIGVSEDGTKFLGITNTNSGWLTFVVDLNGEPATQNK